MSSNAWEKLKIASSDSALSAEIQSFIKARKVIIPLSQEHFSCAALKKSENLACFDLSNYNSIEEYSPYDKTASVQCGIKIKDLNLFLADQKQWLPLSYGSDETSLVEVILTGGAGPYEALFGGLRRIILGLESVLSNGQLMKSGGRVVKNVSGYDLTRFLIGSYGYFAVPVKAHLRLYSLPERFLTMIIERDSLDETLTLARQIFASCASLAYFDIVDRRMLEKDFLDKYSDLTRRFIIITQIYGDQETVEEGAKMIRHLSAVKDPAILEMNDYLPQLELAKSLAQITMAWDKAGQTKPNKIIDLVVSQQQCRDLLLHNDLSPLPFLYRPVSQKLHLSAYSESEQTKVLNILADYANKNTVPLSVAYSDDNYIRTVRKLGCDTTDGDRSFEMIKQSLKSQLDPANLFNPFVKL